MGGRFGSGMMGGYGYGPGQMMGYAQPYTGTLPYGYGMMGGGMMGGHMMGGMMFNRGPLFNPDPLSLTEATEAVEAYLATLNESGLPGNGAEHDVEHQIRYDVWLWGLRHDGGDDGWFYTPLWGGGAIC
jgi:hypothetical protein